MIELSETIYWLYIADINHLTVCQVVTQQDRMQSLATLAILLLNLFFLL